MRPGQLIRRWGLGLALALTSLVSWQASQRGDVDQVSVQPLAYDKALQTPMLSARRVPRTLQAPVADAAIAPRLQAAIDSSPTSSCLLVQVGDRVLNPSANAATALIPASNQKLLTTYAALRLLGPDFRFRTLVLADGAPLNGVVNGNLYLVGDGDPFLTTEDWWSQYEDVEGRYHTRLEDLVDRIVKAGITQVTGSLIGDESLFDSVRQGPWAERLLMSKQSGPLSALTLNEGFVDWPPRFTDGTRLRSETDNPPLHVASALAQLLQASGVTITGTGSGTTPDSALQVADIQSPPLIDTVTHINSHSSNLGAELLLKRLGVLRLGEGSTRAGAQVVTSVLVADGIPTEGLRIDDGSGLAETDRVSCQTLASVLAKAGPDSDFATSLAIGATRGSLRERFVDSPAATRVLAKTGTLNNALALSGYVHSATDPAIVVTFSFLANDDLISADANRTIQDALVVALTGYPGIPSAAELSPIAPVSR